MNKTYYTWKDVETAADYIVSAMYKDLWKPDYIVGITRGGLPLATVISHRTDIPMTTLNVSLRDSELGCESNLWLAEWAFGYVDQEQREIYRSRWDIAKRKKILIVDDINDTGASINWIKKDWESGCFPNELDAWKTVWHNNVKFAVMTNNLSSSTDVDYAWDEVNKAEEDCWLVYPWEKDSWLKKT
jgi:hypoxanthine phosphoribosyltransferase